VSTECPLRHSVPSDRRSRTVNVTIQSSNIRCAKIHYCVSKKFTVFIFSPISPTPAVYRRYTTGMSKHRLKRKPYSFCSCPFLPLSFSSKNTSLQPNDPLLFYNVRFVTYKYYRIKEPMEILHAFNVAASCIAVAPASSSFSKICSVPEVPNLYTEIP